MKTSNFTSSLPLQFETNKVTRRLSRFLFLILIMFSGIRVIGQPIYVSSVTRVGNTSPANVTSLPANVAAGDLLLASIVYSGGTGTTITAPANWTLILQTNRTTSLGIATYYAKFAPGLSSSFTITSGANWSMSVSRITGAAECGILSNGATQSNSTTITAPTITTTNNNTIVLNYYANLSNSSLTAPTGYTAAFNAPSGGTSPVSHMLVQYSKATAGATGNLNVTGTRTANVGQQIAISTNIDKPTANTPQTFCGGSTVSNLSASGLAGATLSWFTTASGGTALTSATALSTGSYYVSQRNANGESCERTAVSVAINSSPLTQTYTSSGIYSYCADNGGSEIALNSSESGVSYQLRLSGSNVGSPVSGIGGTISLGTHSTIGTYTVLATNATTGCSTQLGNATLSSKPLPIVYNVGGGGAFCTGTTGKTVTLSNSQTGVTYQLTKNGSIADGTLNGTNNTPLSFTNKGTGTYTISATLNGCSSTMNGSATVSEVASPVSGTISGNQNLYIGLNSTLTSSNPGGSWSTSNASIVSINGSGVATGVASGSATITYTVSNAGCSASSTYALSVLSGNVWKGSTDTKWTEPTNWGMGRAPLSTDNVIIASATNLPVIGNNSTITLSTLTISTGAHIKVNGTLNLTGTINNSGYLDVSTGTVGFTGTSAQTIPAGLFLSNTVKNLRISNTAGVTLAGTLEIKESLIPASGTLFTGGNLIFKSNQNTSAYVAQGSSAGGYVSGDVTVERFISSRGNKGYRFLAPSVNSTGTIQANWQEGVNNSSTTVNIPSPTPGYGTHITGNGGPANGFDASSAYGTWSSLYTFNNINQSWDAIPNTNATNFSGKTGYLIYLRGNRNDITPVSTLGVNGETTLRTRGTLLQGTQQYSGLASIGNYSAIANPYVSALSWLAISNSNSNIEGIYWIWDPNINESGGYVAIDRSGIKSVAQSNASDIIPSGSTFFVKRSSGSGTLSILESHKSTNNTIDLFSIQSEPATSLSISLKYNVNQQQRIADGAIVAFNNQFSDEVNSEDGTKFANVKDNISILNTGVKLSIEKRSLLKANDSIQLMMTDLSQKKYELEFSFNEFNGDTLNVNLFDRYTNSSSRVEINGINIFPFEVSSEPASYAPDRFVIVMSSKVAPVKFYRVLASKELGHVNITWAVDQENHIASYSVEKSEDGKQFEEIGRVAPKGNNYKLNSYDFEDHGLLTEHNYYRIKLADLFGKSLYSSVSYLKIESYPGKLNIYPNPVANGLLQINLINLEKGKYSIELFDHLGRSVYQKDYEHSGQSGNLQIDLSSRSLKGNFILKLQKIGGQPLIKKISFL